jgi:hypothetical protein
MLELDGDAGPTRVLVNTQRPNALVEAAVRDGTIVELAVADLVEREVKYGTENSRIDLRLSFGDRFAYVEVKNATMGVGGGRTLFPDAVTERGAKHLRELMGVVAQGHRGVLVFCAGRDDTQRRRARGRHRSGLRPGAARGRGGGRRGARLSLRALGRPRPARLEGARRSLNRRTCPVAGPPAR